MSEEAVKEASLHYLPFKGKKDEWPMWSEKFLSKARKKGYKELLIGKQTPPSADETRLDDEAKLLRRLNEEAFDDLVTSMEDKVAFSKVTQAKTPDLPDGDAALAWKLLCSKYKPNTMQNRADLKLQFVQLKLNDWTKDPDEWINKLEEIRSDLKMMNSSISDEDMKIHILNNLAAKYESITEKLVSDMTI